LIKKSLIGIIGLFFSMGSFAQKNPGKETTPAAQLKLGSAADTVQYTLGAFIAQWINSNGFLINNPAIFLRGMNDMFQNHPRAVPDSTIGPSVAAYQRAIQKERSVKQEQQLFAMLRDRPGVGKLPNGVSYVILRSGKGLHPADSDSILLHLNAKLLDGTVVEDSYHSNKPFIATPSSFFAGLNEALQMMLEGSKWQLFVPAALAYGERGTTLIPPNSALVLEAELLAVRKKAIP
jgi:FKBP-type peptidyl-prolyl cis-trans isomerase